mgnify:CR=1 FL=1
MIYSSILELIGHTPLLQLNAMKKVFGFGANFFAKLAPNVNFPSNPEQL